MQPVDILGQSRWQHLSSGHRGEVSGPLCLRALLFGLPTTCKGHVVNGCEGQPPPVCGSAGGLSARSYTYIKELGGRKNQGGVLWAFPGLAAGATWTV